ncbi:hypothetical protein LJK87_47950 [Paenibacillus sp. P25]|nr:hypothetical protein LJK87_47950 [Paenibacillus sp. P25]
MSKGPASWTRLGGAEVVDRQFASLLRSNNNTRAKKLSAGWENCFAVSLPAQFPGNRGLTDRYLCQSSRELREKEGRFDGTAKEKAL